ncbi:alpha/beta fold hydrolase [Desertibaculum subflavum]|uniref:alpha/beta fold hydrolase n=1 Tax=Desertibaculum subflavum TaxID=2268458 RepID=UPI0013C4D70E
MPKADIGDGEIYYEKVGSGPALMLVPGLSGVGVAGWRPQIEAFAPHFTVITHDHRGCGQSTHSRITYSVDQMAADALKLMDALGIKQAHYVGHSTGGAMGQIIAGKHPDRIGRLVLSATWRVADPFFKLQFKVRKRSLLDSGVEAYAEAAALALYPPAYIRDHADQLERERQAGLAAASAPEITASRIDAICAFDGTPHLKSIRAPSLIVVAEDDTVTPRYLSDDLKAHLREAQYEILPRGGHLVPRAEPVAYNAVVLPFLRGE